MSVVGTAVAHEEGFGRPAVSNEVPRAITLSEDRDAKSREREKLAPGARPGIEMAGRSASDLRGFFAPSASTGFTPFQLFSGLAKCP